MNTVFFLRKERSSIFPPSSPAMPSRQLPPSPNLVPTRTLFLVLITSFCVIIILALLYLLYHFYSSLLSRTRTIPLDSTPPLKLRRFSYRELKTATNGFAESNVVGKGGSGTVFKGQLRDGETVAVKTLDALSLETEREFQNEIQILCGLKSPFLVTLLGFCVEKNKHILVYEYMPNRSLQDSIFSEGQLGLSWESRFSIVLDVARALEFLHRGCDPPIIHGDVKPSNVLLDSDFRAKLSDFGISRLKLEEGELGFNLFSQELSGALSTPIERADSPLEVDVALALQASSSSKASPASYNAKGLIGCCESDLRGWNENRKGKEVSVVDIRCGDDWIDKFGHGDGSFGFNGGKDTNLSTGKKCEKDWWWRQDGNGEMCSKNYVKEWIGSQISPSNNPERDENVETNTMKRHRKMQDWWKEERVLETATKEKQGKGSTKLRNLRVKWRKGFKLRPFDLVRRFYFHREQKSADRTVDDGLEADGEFMFRRSGDLFSRELSGTMSTRGTLCYVAPEYGGCSLYLVEKSDIYSFGVLILVILSGRRPLHVLASPMKLEKANLVNWCRQLAVGGGDVLEIMDERLKGEFDNEQARVCANLALACLQKVPELRPDIGDIVRVLKGEKDLTTLLAKFSPSPSSIVFGDSRRKQEASAI